MGRAAAVLGARAFTLLIGAAIAGCTIEARDPSAPTGAAPQLSQFVRGSAPARGIVSEYADPDCLVQAQPGDDLLSIARSVEPPVDSFDLARENDLLDDMTVLAGALVDVCPDGIDARSGEPRDEVLDPRPPSLDASAPPR